MLMLWKDAIKMAQNYMLQGHAITAENESFCKTWQAGYVYQRNASATASSTESER